MLRRALIVLLTLGVLFAATADFVPARLMAAPDQDAEPAQAAEPDQVRKSSSTPGDRANNVYLVLMADLPVSSYAGGVSGLPATKPARGQKIRVDSPEVAFYENHLSAGHDQALNRVGGARKIHDYRFTFNGFAAELTAAQADALRSDPSVVKVIKDTLRYAETSSTPTFLGLDAPGGLWAQLGVDHAGEDVVIGVVDSGVWPESESFSDRNAGEKKSSYDPLPGWPGKCKGGEQFRPGLCNNKLIAARHYNDAWGGDAALELERPWEFMSPRDYNGHGTHTASTAGGNHGVKPNGDASAFGPISGMAPRARIAAYKALWSTEDGATASGFTSDLVAAIDQAVADGVDVINYSISGTSTDFADPVELAFLFAGDAGVFVAASAGNSGPTVSTVAHPSPWITTVAAGTHNRTGEGSVKLGSGVTYSGPSVATHVSAGLIDSTAAGLPGADPTALSLCYAAIDNGGTAVLDPAKVAGKIVVCDRGVNARVNKSLAVLQAGGVGMILVNTASSSLNADFHFVPTVHLSHTDRPAVKAYAAMAKAKAEIAQSTIVYNVAAPLTAAFSSRGPLRAGGGDLLKPDIIAPGQDILAAVAPPANGGRSFNVYSGTSMSSPHVAGLGALLKDLHPDWTPMMIKSALMTSASDVLDGPNTSSTIIFRQGAGHVVPNKAGDPGLVYDSGTLDWLAFLCGTTTAVSPGFCSALVAAGYSTDPSNLNSASIAIGDLAGIQTIKRSVTNVGGSVATYAASVTGVTGFDVAVNPPVVTVNPGETKSFNVSFTRTTAALNAYSGGQLSWSDGSHTVRSPIVARPVALAAPTSVFGTGGTITYGITFGYTGAFSAAARGLVPAVVSDGTVSDDPTDTFSPTGPGVVSFPVTISAGTTYARFSTFDADVTPASDLDVYVYRGSTLVAASAGGTSQEEANLVNPAAGDYVVYVHGFGVPGTAQFRLYSWLLGSTAAGNMTVTAPSAATTGGTGTIELAFNSLAAATRYLGSVAYSGVVGMPNPTIVRVDTP